MSKVETALLDLFNALYDEGITLEMIKVNKPLLHEGHEINSLHGIDVKTIIYEDDSTHWRRL